VIDSTGLKVFGAGEWRRDKHGVRGRRTWGKLHLAVGATTNDGDASQVGPLLDRMSDQARPNSVRSA